jgi:hypothetical protein
MKSFVIALSLALALLVSSNVLAQGYAAYMPVGPVPVAAYYAPAPVVSYGPVVATSYYAPAPYYVAAPVVAPYFVASPVVVGPYAVGPVYGRPVIVRPKVYFPGQPVRNVLRAVTP